MRSSNEMKLMFVDFLGTTFPSNKCSSSYSHVPHESGISRNVVKHLARQKTHERFALLFYIMFFWWKVLLFNQNYLLTYSEVVMRVAILRGDII